MVRGTGFGFGRGDLRGGFFFGVLLRGGARRLGAGRVRGAALYQLVSPVSGVCDGEDATGEEGSAGMFRRRANSPTDSPGRPIGT